MEIEYIKMIGSTIISRKVPVSKKIEIGDRVSFDLGTGRSEGEVIEINQKTVRVLPNDPPKSFNSGRLRKSKFIKRHVEKHNIELVTQ